MPPVCILLGVCPQQVAEQPLVGHIRGPQDPVDLVETVQLGRQPAVHAEYLVVHARTDRVLIEQVCEHLPQLDVEPAFALVLEPLDAVDRRALVVTTEHEEVLRLFHLVRHQQADYFD